MRRGVLAVVVGLGVASPAAADLGLYCGDGELIGPGATQAEVLVHCGEPLTRQVVGTVERKGPGDDVELLIEQWVYDQGEGSFLRILTFHGSQLVAVETGERR